MATARLDYVPPWWTYWLHNFPHFTFLLQSTDNTFKPEEASYQQSVIILACVGAVGLGLSLLILTVYLICLCCCHKDIDEETKRPNNRCITWTAVAAGLIICSAVGVGFYGNSETNDGVYQLTYSLYGANQTIGGINNMVSGSVGNAETGLKQHLLRLDEIFSTRPDYLQSLRFMQLMLNNVVRELTALPDVSKANVDLTAIADQIAFAEYYRWLTYLLLLILDLIICLALFLGMARQSRVLIIMVMAFVTLSLILSWASLGGDTAAAVGASDFCVAPDKFIVNQTTDVLTADVAHYYLFCTPNQPNPFQQSLTVCQRSLTTMQIQIQGLLQFSVPIFPTAERDLLGIQRLLNSTEFSVHQLTALLDCRGLHKDYVDALMGLCYDGVEGLLYLSLFSLLAACALSAMLCATFRLWTRVGSREKEYDDIDEEDPFNPQARRTSYNPRRNQSMLFGGNPRYENVPLIGRGSPPPSYTPSMRTTYLSMTESQIRHFGTDFQV
ncbi:protein tweety homolog 2-like isoform X2 [Cynoglossus semilaevis]|uniref:protein tweety homolog 2-like isoform X2 n=1 Tax=Cynoglossus semilaevis TaxID=244447 RepID=UPI000D62E25B|nr:protein tweety homolog 2-like isoform X2 [Cynoglossus semilaevis]